MPFSCCSCEIERISNSNPVLSKTSFSYGNRENSSESKLK